ncbi:MAG: FG-GAP repeat protein [Planctomycetes bacterium]|nr:FG-GAP repeat protein [Planctomycetota bacterium]
MHPSKRAPTPKTLVPLVVALLSACADARDVARLSDEALTARVETATLFGRSLAAPGDVDHDGVPDLAVGARGSSGSGQVWLLSGRDGAVIDVWTGEPGDDAGAALAVFPRDARSGACDLVVGAPGFDDGRGAVTLRDLRDFAELARCEGELPGDRFGCALGVGDVDGGSLLDVVVGAPGARLRRGDDEAPRAGAVVVLSPADFTPAGGWTCDAPDARFGETFVVASDLDGDGRADVAVAAPGLDAVALRPARPGAPEWFARAPEGRRLAGPPTLLRQGEGVPGGLLVGWATRVAPWRSRVEVLPLDGGAARPLALPEGSSYTGLDCVACVLPDLDGDGLDDFALAWPSGEAWGGQLGHLRVHSGSSLAPLDVADGSAHSRYQGDAWSLTWPDDDEVPWRLGSALCVLGDVDGDGVADLAVGAPDEGLRKGGVVLVSGRERRPVWWTTPETARPARR